MENCWKPPRNFPVAVRRGGGLDYKILPTSHEEELVFSHCLDTVVYIQSLPRRKSYCNDRVKQAKQLSLNCFT